MTEETKKPKKPKKPTEKKAGAKILTAERGGKALFSAMKERCSTFGTKEIHASIEKILAIEKALKSKKKIEETSGILGELRTKVHSCYSSVDRTISSNRTKATRKAGLGITKLGMINFFKGLPSGWVLKINKTATRYENWLDLSIPVPPFKMKYKGLKNVWFRNLIILIQCNGTAPLKITLIKKVRTKVHTGHCDRIHPCDGGGGILCTGNAKASLMNAKNNWDIVSLYLTFLTVVKNYSAGGYSSLRSFTKQQGLRCCGCNMWIPKRKTEKLAKDCPQCYRLYCKDCVSKHFGTVPATNNCYLCDEKKGKKEEPKAICSVCRTNRSKSKIRECVVCKQKVCNTHSKKCGDCDNYTCDKCFPATGTCPGCKVRRPCPSHRSKEPGYKKYGFSRYCVSQRSRQSKAALDKLLANAEKEKTKEETKEKGEITDGS